MQSFEYVITREAAKDINEAFLFYNEQKDNLGDDFLVEIEISLNQIVLNPRLYQKEYKKIRRTVLSKFPFKILYYIELEMVFIFAVFHTSRNPKIWKKRL